MRDELVELVREDEGRGGEMEGGEGGEGGWEVGGWHFWGWWWRWGGGDGGGGQLLNVVEDGTVADMIPEFGFLGISAPGNGGTFAGEAV